MSETTELPRNDAPLPDGTTPDTPAPVEATPKPEPKPWQGKFEASQRRARQEAEQRAATQEAEARQLREEVTRLRAALPPEQQPNANDPAELERRATDRATERLRQEAEQRTFNEACNTTATKIREEFGDTGLAAAATGWTNAGLNVQQPAHRQLLTLITEIDDGHKLYHQIGSDPDLAAHLLTMSPLKAAFELAKLLPREQAAELRADAVAAVGTQPAVDVLAQSAAAPAPARAPAISSAPRPPAQAPASRGATATPRDIYDPKMSADDYAKARAEQKKARRSN